MALWFVETTRRAGLHGMLADSDCDKLPGH